MAVTTRAVWVAAMVNRACFARRREIRDVSCMLAGKEVEGVGGRGCFMSRVLDLAVPNTRSRLGITKLILRVELS